MTEPRYTASTITDDALDRLYARITTLEHVAAGNKRHVQLIVPDLERAEAEVCRVRALAKELADPVHRGLPGIPHAVVAEIIRAALDEPKEPRPDTPVHTGGNAEGCPACTDPNPPYPFICRKGAL